ncbi:MAG: outer membrane protein assembly factor BamD [Bacteroidaceae bacterium]|nr:outer membrane protein assembly factor BamD [Bacteroidaceae bacterium]
MMKKFFYILSLSFVFMSCNEYNKILKSKDYEKKYEYAKKYYDEKKYTRTATLLGDIVTLMKGTPRGEECLFLLGKSHYMNKEYGAASQYFHTYYKNYPRGEFNELARFYCGYGYYLDSPEARLDQSTSYRAIDELQSFLEYYPKSIHADTAQQAIFELQDKLVEKELYNAQLYYNLGNYLMANNYESAAITAQNALKDYPYTKYKEELQYLILKAKYEEAVHSIEEKRLDRYRDVVDEYYTYSAEFPDGKYAKEAKNILLMAEKYTKNN